MAKRATIQQALLKPAFARHYPGIQPNEWQPLAVMLSLVRGSKQRPGERVHLPDPPLDPAHFELRGTASAGSQDAAREARAQRRQRPQS